MTNVPGSNHRWIREALRDEFPEIDDLFSDAYLESVAGVAGRSLEYATEKSIRGALEWRRSYKVEALRKAFFCEELRQHEDVRCETRAADDVRGRIFVPRDADTVCAGDETEGFVPSQELVEVCSSGAFVVLEQDLVVTWEGDDASLENTNRIPKLRLVVYADISRINWWKTGVAAGLQYHVLVLEEAFERIRREHQNHNHNNSINTFTNNNKAKNCERRPRLEESLVLCVDTTASRMLPPPLGCMRGMIRLLQQAYPDRIHKIYVGPISPWLRTLYKGLRPFLKPRSRNKIVLLGEAPLGFLARWPSKE